MRPYPAEENKINICEFATKKNQVSPYKYPIDRSYFQWEWGRPCKSFFRMATETEFESSFP